MCYFLAGTGSETEPGVSESPKYSSIMVTEAFVKVVEPTASLLSREMVATVDCHI